MVLRPQPREVGCAGGRRHGEERFAQELRLHVRHPLGRHTEDERLNGSKRRRRSCQRLIRLQPDERDEDEGPGLVDRGTLPEHERLGAQRNRDVERLADLEAQKVCFGHSDDGERRTLERQRLADGVVTAVESCLPQPIADYRDWSIAAATTDIVFGHEQTADARPHTKRLEKAAADEEHARRIAFAAFRQVERRLRPQQHPVKKRRDLLHTRPHRIAPADARLEAVGEREVGGDGDEPIGFRHRQRPQQQAVDDGEDGGVRPRPERQREYDHERRDGSGRERTDRQTERVHVSSGMRATSSLTSLSCSREPAIPTDDAEECAEDDEDPTDLERQTIRRIGNHDRASFVCRRRRLARPPGYSGFANASCPPASDACRMAAAPSMPPIPIDSTALLGISMSAPFSFSPS